MENTTLLSCLITLIRENATVQQSPNFDCSRTLSIIVSNPLGYLFVAHGGVALLLEEVAPSSNLTELFPKLVENLNSVPLRSGNEIVSHRLLDHVWSSRPKPKTRRPTFIKYLPNPFAYSAYIQK